MISAIYRSAAFALVLGAAPTLLASTPAAAQRGLSMHAETNDSTTRVVPRVPLSYADASLRTRDRQVALLLTNTDVVLQLTDRGLSGVSADIRRGDGDREGLGSRILAHVLSAGVGELLNHGIAAPLSTLRRARVEGSRLVLENREGADLFADVEVNGKQPMEEFSPDEARRFADAVNRAIRQHRAVASAPRR